jgi:hypothetical protein
MRVSFCRLHAAVVSCAARHVPRRPLRATYHHRIPPPVAQVNVDDLLAKEAEAMENHAAKLATESKRQRSAPQHSVARRPANTLQRGASPASLQRRALQVVFAWIRARPPWRPSKTGEPAMLFLSESCRMLAASAGGGLTRLFDAAMARAARVARRASHPQVARLACARWRIAMFAACRATRRASRRAPMRRAAAKPRTSR